MTPWCDDLVCSWRRLLADRHSLPFPWTLSLHRRWCPSASHHPLTFLFLLALTFPLPSPFPSLGLSLCRAPCPSASPHSFPSLSLGRLCQRSPRTYPVSLLCVESTQRKANAFAVGQVRPSGHPMPAVRYLSPRGGGGEGCHNISVSVPGWYCRVHALVWVFKRNLSAFLVQRRRGSVLFASGKGGRGIRGQRDRMRSQSVCSSGTAAPL